MNCKSFIIAHIQNFFYKLLISNRPLYSNFALNTCISGKFSGQSEGLNVPIIVTVIAEIEDKNILILQHKFAKATTSMSGVCSIWHIHHPRGQVTLGAFIAIVSPNPWQMKFAQCERALHPFQGWGITSVQWAPHPSWERRFTQCAVGPSSLLRMRLRQCAVSPSSLLKEKVYLVRSGPSIPLERGGLPSVQSAPHPSREMRFVQCATSPSSLLRDEVYPVCNQPIIPEKWSLPVCNQPLILPERGGLPSVQRALHPSWERRFTQCAVGPSFILREEVYLVCSGPFIPLGRGGLPSVQWALHPSWERRFTQCAVGPSFILREEVYRVCSGPFIPLGRGGLPSVQWAPHSSWERRFT